MSRFVEDMILSCQSMEELEEMRERIKKMREREDLIKNCNHPIVYYLDTIYDYESYSKNLCLKCGQEIEGGHKKIYSKNYVAKNKKYIIAEIFEKIYSDLNKRGMEENDIVSEILDFQTFLDEKEVLKDINQKENDEIKEIVNRTYEIHKEVKKLIKKI